MIERGGEGRKLGTHHTYYIVDTPHRRQCMSVPDENLTPSTTVTPPHSAAMETTAHSPSVDQSDYGEPPAASVIITLPLH